MRHPIPVKRVQAALRARQSIGDEPVGQAFPTASANRPTRSLQALNLVVFQSAWFAAILGAAHRMPLWGTAAVAAAVCWHLSVSARPLQEFKLVVIVCLIGFASESLAAVQGYIVYPSGQPVAYLAPYWMVALWGLLAIALNVTMRWLKTRLWLASMLGAVAGPMSFVSGVRLGGAQFVHAVPALATMACTWAVLMPTLVWLSNRFDGVVVPDVPTVDPIGS